MTNQEFSNEFDTLLNSYAQEASFGNTNNLTLDEYEKSVFLTKAQEEIILELYSDTSSGSFERTEESRRYLDNLLKTAYPISEIPPSFIEKLDISSCLYKLPEDVWFIVFEEVDYTIKSSGCMPNRHVLVYPTTHDDLLRTMRNPFRNANERRVLRVDLGYNFVELFPGKDKEISDYIIRYLSKPSPIVLIDFPDSEDLSINGVKKASECKLHTALHRPILDRAVKLALASKSIGAST